MQALIPMIVLINLAVGHHRMGNRKQTERFLKPRTTGFVKILDNLNPTTIKEIEYSCISSCLTHKAFRSLFIKNYNDQLFVYELEKAVKNMLKIVQRQKVKKWQKNNKIKTDKKDEQRREKGLSKITKHRGILNDWFIRFG